MRNDAPTPKTWRVAVLPNDFELPNLTELEDGTRALSNLDDVWISDGVAEPCHTLDVHLEESQIAIDRRRSENKVEIHDTIAPFVGNFTFQRLLNCTDVTDRNQFTEWYAGALKVLSSEGCKSHQLFALAALVLIKEHPNQHVGRSSAINVTWGEKIQCIDYASQPLQVGTLVFPTMDFGDTVNLSISTQKALCAPSRDETNQFVILHLAAAAEWKLQGCPKRAPGKSRVLALASHFTSIRISTSIAVCGAD